LDRRVEGRRSVWRCRGLGRKCLYCRRDVLHRFPAGESLQSTNLDYSGAIPAGGFISKVAYGQTSTMTLNPTGLPFFNQSMGTTSAPQTIGVSNSSPTPVTISGISITGANSADFAETNNCGTSVAGGASCI